MSERNHHQCAFSSSIAQAPRHLIQVALRRRLDAGAAKLHRELGHRDRRLDAEHALHGGGEGLQRNYEVNG